VAPLFGAMRATREGSLAPHLFGKILMIPKPSIELSQARLDRTLFSFQRPSEALSRPVPGPEGKREAASQRTPRKSQVHSGPRKLVQDRNRSSGWNGPFRAFLHIVRCPAGNERDSVGSVTVQPIRARPKRRLPTFKR
jgi:hypothetical protein